MDRWGHRRGVFGAALVAGICILLAPVLTCAQFPNFPDVPQRCPAPRSAKGRTPPAHPARKASEAKADEAPERKVVVEGIRFDGPVHLPDSDLARITKDLNSWGIDVAGDSDALTELAEHELSEAWIDRGYFKADVNVEAQSLSLNNGEERFLLLGHVVEGFLYHLREIQFSGDDTFPEDELRRAVPLRDGEVFRIAAIRAGIQSLTVLYQSRGFIDFVTVPETQVDDDSSEGPQATIRFQLVPQVQFRIGAIEIVGRNQKLEAQLRSTLKTGEIFNPEIADRFFTENQSALPRSSSRTDSQLLRNAADGTIDLAFDLRPCPKLRGDE
jgi:hemolysin activation/secretion protein